MTTFNTGNPIGSTDARDLSDNAENFDKALGTLDATWTDRLGVTRDSFEGRLAKGSFYRVGDFTAGYTLTNMRQTLEYNGHEYSWAGTFPKVVAAGATPATSGGIGAGAWVDRTDVTLRTQLSRVCQFVTKNAGLTDFVSVKDHGAIGDGVEHPLSSQFSNLLAAQMVYPFATSLTQQIDWAAIQSAIFTGKPVWVPDGQYLSSDEIEQVSAGQVIQFSNTGGYGYGEDALQDFESNAYNSRIIGIGTFAKRIRTRRLFRGSASDPQDAPLSVLLNIQGDGAKLINPAIHLYCDYTNTSPTNFGADCDIGIFVGCRVGVQIHDPQVIGYFRKTGIHVDVTGADNLPRHLSVAGTTYPTGQNVGGCDGIHIFNPYVRGARRGLGILGSLPKSGQTGYSDAYYDEQLGITVPDRRGFFGASDFMSIGGRIYGPDHHSNWRLKDPELVSGVLGSASLLIEPDDAPCAMFIDGLAGNASGSIWGMRFLGTRFATFEALRIRLGRCGRPAFIESHVEGRTTTQRYSSTGVALPTISDYTKISYSDYACPDTRCQWLKIIGSYRTSKTGGALNHFYGDDYSIEFDNGDYHLQRIYAMRDFFTSGNFGYYNTDNYAQVRGAAGFGVRFFTGSTTIATMSASGMTFAPGVTSDIFAGAGELGLRAATGSGVRLRSGSSSVMLATTTAVAPGSANTQTCGTASAPWSGGYTQNAFTVTSDRDYKQDIEALNDALLDAWELVNYCQFRFKDRVEEKGDAARYHVGVIAQDIKSAFEAAGIDPFRYGILGYDEWGDEYEPVMIEKEIPIFDENNNQTGVDIILVDSGEKVLTRKAGSRYNVNPTEALMLEAALMRRALNSLKVN